MVSRGLPTAAKLAGALGFAAVGWLGAAVLGPDLPEAMKLGMVPEAAAVAGLLTGWHIAGVNAGRGFGQAVATGLRTGVVLVVLVLLGVAIWQMLGAAVDKKYTGPFMALLGMLKLMLRYGAILGTVPFVSVMVVGSALAGVLTEIAGRRWS